MTEVGQKLVLVENRDRVEALQRLRRFVVKAREELIWPCSERKPGFFSTMQKPTIFPSACRVALRKNFSGSDAKVTGGGGRGASWTGV